MKFVFKANILTVVLATAFLISCGGGDGGGSSSDNKSTLNSGQTLPPETKADSPEQEPKPEPKPEGKVSCSDVHPYESYLMIGDSLTLGVGDAIAIDNITNDGCFKSEYGGYPPVLISKLNDEKGRKHKFINRGKGGARSRDGVRDVAGLLDGDFLHVIVMYGTNDSSISDGTRVDPKKFKSNMQNIIKKIRDAGKNAYIAKIPPVLAESNHHKKYSAQGIPLDKGTRNQVIQQYNKVIDELVRENGITISPPNLYDYFKSRPERYSDNIHLNGKGYQDLANLWWQKLRTL